MGRESLEYEVLRKYFDFSYYSIENLHWVW